MKKNLMIIAGCIAGLAYSTVSYAQKPELLPDQNPRYQETRAKYIELADSLTSTQGTTVQNTYKAYDWYTARAERRQLRRERNAAYDWYNPYYGNSYFGNSYFYPSLGSSISLGFGSRHGWGSFGYGFGGGWGGGRRWNRW
ncbi:hypothetical protein PBAL39_11275 [Pedobacter sp. BAL39]|uniref:hypothetical protein n=1 Tax=Pedobacter sp. BAL39 TaxID=391596 RepID=UPI000155A909|nr:hypothetical protein [Pedobacter sp. BAL39]EDM34575.1 hypothetical protein PBAL39_11275 [Pedobacter sp. BAL39]